MCPAVARIGTASVAASFDDVDLATVQVELTVPGRKRRTSLGTAREALADRRLTAAERSAIATLVRAVALLRTRAQLNGIDDAGQGVTLVLRDADATKRGPWATQGSVAVGSTNALASRAKGRAVPSVLLTVDTAVHELAHVVQFGTMSNSARPEAAILEGIADAAAVLATGDDTLGEGFYRRDAAGRPTGAIRELGERAPNVQVLGPVITQYRDAIRPGAEEHAAGGVVSATFIGVRSRLGRERAEQLLWHVIRDRSAWTHGGSWRELAQAITRAASQVWPNDASAYTAVEASLRATGLIDAR